MISGKTKLAGVIGYPIEHSKSPLIHNYWLKEYDIDGVYIPLSVKPENLEEVLRALPKMGFKGVNITVPHKVAALEIVDTVTDNAKRIGAVNTVIVQDDGSLTGDNTDGFGFIENLKVSCPEWKCSNGFVVVFGSGGASRAVCAALMDAGVKEIRVVNRTPEKAENMIADLGGKLVQVPWSEKADCIDGASMIVNTTTMGMKDVPQFDINLSLLSSQAVVYDIVYSPLKTGLLRRAGVRGNWTVGGLGMLLHQAKSGFEAWFGKKPEVTKELYDFIAEK